VRWWRGRFARGPGVLLLSALQLAARGGAGPPPRQALTPTVPPSPATSVSPGAPAPTGNAGSGLAGAFVMDLTWVSSADGWALAAAPCARGLCPRIARTEDGGRSWSELADPPADLPGGQVDCTVRACVSGLRFASGTIGYLFGPALLMTRDGGRTWTPVPGPPVESLEPGAGDVVRVVYDHTGCPGPCHRVIEAAPAGSSDWRVLFASLSGHGPSRAVTAQVIRAGPQVIYVPVYGDLAAGAGSAQVAVYRSRDAGRSWDWLADPCGGRGPTARAATDLAAAPGGLCAPASGAPTRGYTVVTSNDDGNTWGPSRPVPASARFTPDLIAAARPSDLVITNSLIAGGGPYAYQLAVSTDGGAHWATVVNDPEQIRPTAPYASYLGFQNASVGRWIGDPHTIWTTTDGGRHWTKQPFP